MSQNEFSIICWRLYCFVINQANLCLVRLTFPAFADFIHKQADHAGFQSAVAARRDTKKLIRDLFIFVPVFFFFIIYFLLYIYSTTTHHVTNNHQPTLNWNLSLIFQQCDKKDSLQFELVCRNWKETLKKFFSLKLPWPSKNNLTAF